MLIEKKGPVQLKKIAAQLIPVVLNQKFAVDGGWRLQNPPSPSRNGGGVRERDLCTRRWYE